MIVKVNSTSKSYYGKYFYVGESTTKSGDDEVIMEARTRRRRVRVTDNEPSEEREPIDTGEAPDNSPVDAGEAPDNSPIDAGEAPDNSPVDAGEAPENEDDNNAEINTDDPNGEEDDSGNTNDDSNTDNNDGNNNSQEQPKGPGLEYDSTRKYVLFQNFIALNDAITNYISKLEKIIGDSIEENRLIKESIDKLNKIQTLCMDYMLMKFEISSYVQSQLFYQNLIIMIQMVFDLYTKTSSKIKNNKIIS